MVFEWQRSFVRWFLVGIVLVLLLALTLLMFSPIVQVQEIRVKKTDPRLDIDQVQQALAPLFGRHFLLLSNLT